MASNGEDDLNDFLKREEEKFSQLGDPALTSSPPPDIQEIITQRDEKERAETEALAFRASLEDESSNISALELTPAVYQRRSSVEAIPESSMRRSSLEATSIEMASTALSQDTGDSMFSVEPECIQAWRRDKEEMLDQKEAEASEEMRKWREAAQQELRDWYDHHNSQVETRKQDNRAAEQAFIDERDQLVPGTEWEKVANLCDFSAKGPGRNSKDVSRMRSIYLHLKENPPVQKIEGMLHCVDWLSEICWSKFYLSGSPQGSSVRILILN
ncbi:Clathrin light chain A-like [Oopsacas minuta]|uniref:Clathrin light chain n=1 Tax=Oopsacas minuta TaxID=111878 RepID=A0AAV7JZX7_9METZ|nr:Clathrin light chain A-like [Oopsacas minuta]